MRAFARTATFALALASLQPLPAQQDAAATVLIEGVVLDKDGGSPVAGARVSVVGFAQGREANPAVATGVTDGNGHFEVHPRSATAFSVSALAEGYSSQSSTQRVTLSDGLQSAHIDIQLARLGTVKGIFVDAETRKPIAGLRIQRVYRGSLVPTNGRQGATVTPADGSFVIGDLEDAEFFLRVETPPGASIETIPAKDLEGDNRDKALKAPEGQVNYSDLHWPGGDSGLPQTPGLHVSGTLDLGEIRLEKRTLHTITGVVNGCDPGAKMQLLFTPPARFPKTLDQDLLCGEGFRILNYSDGDFTLSLVQGGPPRRFTFQQIGSATRGPLTLTPVAPQTVQLNVELEGVPPADTPSDLQGIRIEVQPESAPVRISTPSRAVDGTLEADLFPGLRYTLNIPMPAKYYLKKLSYNGVDSNDLAGFTAYGGALRLIFSSHPGSIQVTVADPAQYAVFAISEGTPYSALTFSAQGNPSLGAFRQMIGRPDTQRTADGSVTLSGLPPARYRVFGYATLTPPEAEFNDLMRTAASVLVDEGQTATISIGPR